MIYEFGIVVIRTKSKVIIVANTVWYLANFRLNLAIALIKAGYQVTMVAPPGDDSKKLVAAGICFIPVVMDNKGTNPVADMCLLWRLYALLSRERPAVFLGYTIKPNIYGGLACRMLKIPSIHNISGLGTAFINDSWVTRLVRLLYRVGLDKATKIFFQNPDDLSLFEKFQLVDSSRTERLPGSGVDTHWFAPTTLSESMNSCFCFLLFGRLLWDKGVGEYVEAARQLRGEGKEVEFQLLGFLDVENRSSIPRNIVEKWEVEGVVRYLGNSDDVRRVIAQADCVVLPSYREGTPRSLLEAASMAKPIITTDSVGCRETIVDEVTGFLCKTRDADDLASKMLKMMDLTNKERLAMGQCGREKMIQEFDEKIVIDRYLSVVEKSV